MYDDALAPVGIGVNQYAILSKLDRFGPQGLKDLARRLVMDRSTLGRLLRPLENRDLLTVTASEQDARRSVITLSGAGEALLVEARPLWEQAQRCFEHSFGTDEAQSLRTALSRAATLAYGKATTAEHRQRDA